MATRLSDDRLLLSFCFGLCQDNTGATSFKTSRLKDAPIGWIYLERRILISSADDYRRIEQMKFGQGSSAVVSKVRIRISLLPLPAAMRSCNPGAFVCRTSLWMPHRSGLSEVFRSSRRFRVARDRHPNFARGFGRHEPVRSLTLVCRDEEAALTVGRSPADPFSLAAAHRIKPRRK